MAENAVMNQEFDARDKQLNESWKRLLSRLLASPSPKWILQLSASLFERLERRRTNELIFVSETLRGALDKLESEASNQSRESKLASSASEIAPSVSNPLYFALLSLHDVTVSFQYAVQRELADRTWHEFVNSETPKSILLTIAKHGTRTNAELRETVSLSESRMSQRLRPLREAGLIDYDKDGQRRHYRLTDLGREHLEAIGEWDGNSVSGLPDEKNRTVSIRDELDERDLADQTSDTAIYFAAMASCQADVLQEDATSDLMTHEQIAANLIDDESDEKRKKLRERLKYARRRRIGSGRQRMSRFSAEAKSDAEPSTQFSFADSDKELIEG